MKEKISFEKPETGNLVPEQYRGLLRVAQLPEDNQDRLFNFPYYDLTPVDHDYAGQFQKKANHVFRELKLPLSLVMMIGNPQDSAQIYQAFAQDPRYSGGGTGSGFKDKAPALMAELDPLAKLIGAINVIVKTEKGLKGYNTDGLGFAQGLEKLYLEKRKISSLQGLKTLILGAGGTARAIAFTLAQKGLDLTIINRTTEKAEELAASIRQADGQAQGGGEDQLPQALAGVDLVINTSTKGAEGPWQDFGAFAPAQKGALAKNLDLSRQALKLLKKEALVCDINLRASESPSLILAREAGHLTQDGSAMNFYQAVEALWLMHGQIFHERNISKEKIIQLIKEVS